MSDELTRCHIFPSLDSKTGWYCSSCHKDVPEYGCHRAGLKSASDSARNGAFQAVQDESRSFWRRVEPYPSHGRTYYRYRWGKGHQVEGVRHVPGGNQDNPIVQSRAIALWRAVNLDALPHAQVLQMVENWRCRKRSQR